LNLSNKNRDPEIACHRVVHSDGKSGGFNRGIKEKIKILRKEGVNI
jgi:O6-methylguanine-DNA--protein-cysteine methyltransferase